MNEKQHSFVTEYLRLGDKISAYRKAYNCYDSSYRTMESAANRLLNNTEVATAIVEVQNRIRNEVEYELKQELRTELLTVQRKRELLALIATGEMWVEQHDKGKDCNTCTRMVRPTINQMLKAIDLDSKLAGHYTNKKQMTVVHTTTPSTSHPQDTGSFPVVRETSKRVLEGKNNYTISEKGGLRLSSKTEGTETNAQPSCHPELDSGSREIPHTPNERKKKPENHNYLPTPLGEGQVVRPDIISPDELNELLNTPLQKETQQHLKRHIPGAENILKE